MLKESQEVYKLLDNYYGDEMEYNVPPDKDEI